jgi:hypothetical protein
MSTLLASKEVLRVLTDNFTKSLPINNTLPLSYQLLIPTVGFHLQVTCKVTEGSHWYHRHFYFPEGSYTPQSVYDYIKKAEAEGEENNTYWGNHTLINHQYLPVWDGTLPELKDDEVYYVTALTMFYCRAMNHYHNFNIEATYIHPPINQLNLEDITAYLIGNPYAKILTVVAKNPWEIEALLPIIPNTDYTSNGCNF